MRSYSVGDGDLARLIEQTLKGEPQRITAAAGDVVLASEAEWRKRTAEPRRTLLDILLDYAEDDFSEVFAEQPWTGLRP